MKSVKMNMNYVNSILLVVVLVLVIMCCMNKNNDGFKCIGRRNFENKMANELRNKFMKR